MTEDKENREIVAQNQQRLLQEKEQFKPILQQVIESDPRFLTIGGLAIFAHNIQNELYRTDALTKGDLGRAVSNSGVEFLSRVAATLLDRTDVNLSYEVGNLSPWLRRKGLDAKLVGHTHLDWSKGGHGTSEDQTWFSQEDFTPGGLVLAAEFLSLKLSELAALSEKQDDKTVLQLASSVSSVVAEEVRSIAVEGKPLYGATVKAMLKTPLASVGISIVDRRNVT